MRNIVCVVIVVAIAAPAAAQDRPIIFSVATTATDAKPAVRVDYDLGVGERAFQSDTSNRPEQRIGIQASRGRLTLLGRVGIAEVGSSYQSNQSGELLCSLVGSSRTLIAAGGGVLHEAGGQRAAGACDGGTQR